MKKRLESGSKSFGGRRNCLRTLGMMGNAVQRAPGLRIHARLSMVSDFRLALFTPWPPFAP
jgi:hypothetical protein